MKKTSIYLISILIGLVLGFLLYSFTRVYFPVDNKIKTDYILYDETNYNLKDFKITYGLNIDQNIEYQDFIQNIASLVNTDNFNVTKYYKKPMGENYYAEFPSEYNFLASVLDPHIESIYGPNYKFEYENFKYSSYFGISSCKYESKDKKYYCTAIYVEEELDDLIYDTVAYSSLINESEEVVTKYYIYYLKYGCDGEQSICLYSDPQRKYLLTKNFKEDELKAYYIRLSKFTAVFSKAKNNKYYLKTLNW